MLYRFVILFVSLYTIKANWSNSFDEQYHVFGDQVCSSHYNRDFTTFGMNYRLDRDGQYIFKSEGRESSKKRVNGPASTFYECSTMCQENSKCVAFAYRHEDNLCQFMAHCKMTDGANSDFRYFTKKAFGCMNLKHLNGHTCMGKHALELDNHTIVEECLEKATEYGAHTFSIDGDMNCRVWDNCNETRLDNTSTIYYVPEAAVNIHTKNVKDSEEHTHKIG